MFLIGIQDHLAGNQFNHLQSSLFPSTSSASVHPNVFNSEPMLPFIPPHEVGNPWDDFINLPWLHNELLYSEFGKIPDLTWLSSFGNEVPSEQNIIQNLHTPEPPFESMASHGDLSVSQLSMQFDHFDDLLWPPLWAHSPWPEPQLNPQQSEVQSLLEPSGSQYNPHSIQYNFQGQASHQIESFQPSGKNTYSQGK